MASDAVEVALNNNGAIALVQARQVDGGWGDKTSFGKPPTSTGSPPPWQV